MAHRLSEISFCIQTEAQQVCSVHYTKPADLSGTLDKICDEMEALADTLIGGHRAFIPGALQAVARVRRHCRVTEAIAAMVVLYKHLGYSRDISVSVGRAIVGKLR